MKKLILSLIVGLSLIVSSSVFASVGVKIDGANIGNATYINLTGPDQNNLNGGVITIPVVDDDLFATGAADGGATSMVTTDEAVPVGFAYVRKALAADATYDDGTLANGEPGQFLTLEITEDLGSINFVVTPTLATGWATVGFDAVGERATWLYIDDTVGWVVVNLDGATLTRP